jgi:hypothetical protein
MLAPDAASLVSSCGDTHSKMRLDQPGKVNFGAVWVVRRMANISGKNEYLTSSMKY